MWRSYKNSLILQHIYKDYVLSPFRVHSLSWLSWLKNRVRNNTAFSENWHLIWLKSTSKIKCLLKNPTSLSYEFLALPIEKHGFFGEISFMD